MCFAAAPPPVQEPVDRSSEAAAKAFGRAQRRRAGAFGESDTDVVGSFTGANDNVAPVTTQLKRLIGE